MAGVEVVPIPVAMGPMNVMAYLLLGERVVVVDTGLGGQADRILAAIASHGRTPSDVSLILLTHGHGDHAGSAAALREATGAPIALGAGDEEKCFMGRDSEMHGRGVAGAAMLRMMRRRQATLPANAGPIPDIILDAERSLEEYGIDAVVTPTPGHSRGSVTVFTADGDALVGDLLGGGGLSHREPRRALFVADEAAMEASIGVVMQRATRLVYTGHDVEPFTVEQLKNAFGRS